MHKGISLLLMLVSLQLVQVACEAAPAKVAVAYFSHPQTRSPHEMTQHENDSTVVVDGKVYGNTEYFAMQIAKTLNADLRFIEPAEPYPTGYVELVERAKLESSLNLRPPLRSSFDFRGYDVVFVGSPIWWYSAPPVMKTFYENTDFGGATVIPFGSSGGSGFCDTIEYLEAVAQNAKVYPDGLTISRLEMEEDDRDEKIAQWLLKLKAEIPALAGSDN